MLSEKDFGFWHILGSLKIRSLFWPEGVWALTIGLIGSVVLLEYTAVEIRYSIAGDYLVMASVLLGVVFATLALVVSLLSDSYLQFLNKTDKGFLPFMAPFVVGVGIQATTLVAALVYRITNFSSSCCAEQIGFIIATVLFVYALFDIISLAKKVVAHAVTRAEYLSALKE